MVRGNNGKQQKRSKVWLFFMSTLVMWVLSVGFELVSNKRRELVPVFYGCFMFQLANWVLRSWVSREPLFVNTSVSLLHSSFASASATLVMWVLSVGFELVSNKRRELVPVFYGCFMFQLANWVLRSWVSREPLFVNTSVSLLHSSFASASVVFILLNQWSSKHLIEAMFDHEELVQNTWPWAYTALCVSCGYFAYDQWDMLKYGLYSGWFPSILAHHLILLVCFTLALYRNVTINYLILTLICELHSVFLHVRKVRRMAGIRSAESTIVKAEWFLNWLTFVFARVVPHVMILIKLVKDAPKFDKGVELPLALFGMVGMNLLNIGLGIDIFGAYRRELNQHTD